MQNLYDEVGSLDQRCYEQFGLSEDVLMENAASAIAQYIKEHFLLQSSVLIVSGSGNNGADGITLSRILHQDYNVKLFIAKEAKSPMAKLQLQRALAVGVEVITELPTKTDVVVDAILGTGFNGELQEPLSSVIAQLNAIDGYKIACDVPSGLRSDGTLAQVCFQAQTTITMGALKKSLFLDMAKDVVGEIQVADLGIARSVYEVKSAWKVLDEEDLQLPYRVQQDTHKGSYGHSCIVSGEKVGAGVLSGLAALKIGAALVTLLSKEERQIPYSLMQSTTLPANVTAIALGMGLGEYYLKEELEELSQRECGFVIDADMFYKEELKVFLTKQKVVLTPHPKEFVSLLKVCGIADISIAQLQSKRFFYVEQFSMRYPNVTLLLKGANMIIATEGEFFVNPHGSAKLAKGGSGDVLSGLVVGLLAQGYSPKDAALHGSLVLAKLAKLYKKADFSLDPLAIIELIAEL